MLVAASVLPHPPLLIPELSVAQPDWLQALREAVSESVQALVESAPELIVVVGSAPRGGEWDESAGGTMAPYGVDVRSGGATAELPLSLTVAARLLDDIGWDGPRRYAALATRGEAQGNAATGAALAAASTRVALIAMGDGSAKRTTAAPGYIDARARAFDAAVVSALAERDAAALLAMSSDLAAELWVAGLPSWQALAGALDHDADLEARVRYDDAPRGVGYFVVDWNVRRPAA